jgi:alanyl-tRNA synthetase
LNESERRIGEIGGVLKAKPEEVTVKTERLVSMLKEQEKEITRLKELLAASKAKDISSEIREVEGIKVLSKKVDSMGIEELRSFGDSLRSRIGSGIVAVGSEVEGKAAIVVMVTKDLTNSFNARDIINEIAVLVDGRGGGRDDMAQAGGKKPEGLQEALDMVVDVVVEMARKKRRET